MICYAIKVNNTHYIADITADEKITWAYTPNIVNAKFFNSFDKATYFVPGLIRKDCKVVKVEIKEVEENEEKK